MTRPVVMVNKGNGMLYTAVASYLPKRTHEHKAGITGGFSSPYRCTMLVYFDIIENIDTVIMGEKQIKRDPGEEN